MLGMGTLGGRFVCKTGLLVSTEVTLGSVEAMFNPVAVGAEVSG